MKRCRVRVCLSHVHSTPHLSLPQPTLSLFLQLFVFWVWLRSSHMAGLILSPALWDGQTCFFFSLSVFVCCPVSFLLNRESCSPLMGFCFWCVAQVTWRYVRSLCPETPCPCIPAAPTTRPFDEGSALYIYRYSDNLLITTIKCHAATARMQLMGSDRPALLVD